jgi:Predicted hydrolase (metallo-beta-lactamase superfamily)
VSVIKSFAVGHGDMFYIRHGSDNFSIVDCNINDDNADRIIEELKAQSADKGITRFICTHPDQDHFGGIGRLDDAMPIANFYCVQNQATKDPETESFKRYCKLRDGDKAFHIYKGCTRKWMNKEGDGRGSAGLNILWPDTNNEHFKEALASCDAGEAFNNTSAVIRYQLQGGASFMWLGDLETDFMENITDAVDLKKTTVVVAAHHGRNSGKIPNSWLEKLDPQFIIIGEAPSRHLNYYTGYSVFTQNKAGDLTFDLVDDKVHVYASNEGYSHKKLTDEGQTTFEGYVGSFTVETEYTL